MNLDFILLKWVLYIIIGGGYLSKMAGCIDRSIMRTMQNMARNRILGLISGHSFKEIEYFDCNIQLLECVECGKISAAWKYNEVSKEELKRIEREKQIERRNFSK